jgi:hypothetical protein
MHRARSGRHLRVAGALLESSHFVERVTAKQTDIWRRQRSTKLTCEQQQRARRSHERVQTDAQELECPFGERIDARRWRRLWP